MNDLVELVLTYKMTPNLNFMQDSGVGKTSIVRRLVHNSFSNEEAASIAWAVKYPTFLRVSIIFNIIIYIYQLN